MLNNKYIILTAFHNADKYLLENIQGSLSQSYNDVGIIFINDGSYDDSENVLFENISLNQSGSVWTGQASGKDILYIKNSERNGCPALSQKLAIDNYVTNTGAMCCIVDGDDYLAEERAITLIDMEIEDNHLMFCSNKNLVDINGDIYGSIDSSKIRESGYKSWESGDAYLPQDNRGFYSITSEVLKKYFPIMLILVEVFTPQLET